MQSSVKFRRNYFINKAFQLNFIIRFVFLVVIGGVFSGCMLYFFMSHKLSVSPEIVFFSAMDALLPAIIITQLIVSILIIIASIYVVLILSHRIAGPLYRLERVAEHVGNGDLSIRVGFRDKDALMPLKSSFQTMIDKLQHKVLKLQDNLTEMKKVEQEFRDKDNGSPLSDIEKKRLTKLLHNCISRYEENLKSFKMPSQ